MASPASARGGLGWVILVVALAVPGVLFFNWWSHLKTDREKAVAAKARGRVPEGGVFQASPNSKLVNPMSPVPSTAAATSPAAAPANAAAAVVPSGAAPAPHDALLATAAVPAGAQAPAAGDGQAPSASTTTVVALALKRDPTLSPFDLVRIGEEEEAKRKAAEDLENMKRAKQDGKRSRKTKIVNPVSMLNLQGIVSNPESGFKAIVNDEVLGAGEYVGSTRIKIIKITELAVTFDYQGKRFSKGVNRD